MIHITYVLCATVWNDVEKVILATEDVENKCLGCVAWVEKKNYFKILIHFNVDHLKINRKFNCNNIFIFCK